jgi:hypothetical protein
MEALLNALAAPNTFAEDRNRPGVLQPAFAAIALTLLGMLIMAPVAIDLIGKRSNTFESIGTNVYGAYYGFGTISSLIAILVKWGFATFFLGTALQFAKQPKTAFDEENNLVELPHVEYSGMLQLVAYSGVILSFESLIKAFAVVIKNSRDMIVSEQDLDIVIGLNLLVEKMNVGAFLYAFLGEINPITLWGYGILAFWIVRIYRIRPALVYGTVGALWLLCTILIAAMHQFSANMTGAAR